MEHVFIRTELPPVNRAGTGPRGKNRDWTELAHALRAAPGEWHMIIKDANPAYAAHLRNGRTGNFADADQWEIITRNNDVYIRFTGSAGADFWTEPTG